MRLNSESKIYKSPLEKLTGSNYKTVNKKALAIFASIKVKTKRKPYIRSPYFSKDKIFFDYFREHIRQKPIKERIRRLKFFPAAIDLIRNSHIEPEINLNPGKRSERLYRFKGINKNQEIFCVQIKENIRKKSKQFMSVFPIK